MSVCLMVRCKNSNTASQRYIPTNLHKKKPCTYCRCHSVFYIAYYVHDMLICSAATFLLKLKSRFTSSKLCMDAWDWPWSTRAIRLHYSVMSSNMWLPTATSCLLSLGPRHRADAMADSVTYLLLWLKVKPHIHYSASTHGWFLTSQCIKHDTKGSACGPHHQHLHHAHKILHKLT